MSNQTPTPTSPSAASALPATAASAAAGVSGAPGLGTGTASGGVALLEVHGLARRYGNTPVFEEVYLSVRRGEVVALLGESGVGKSTLLNCVAGLDTPDAGSVSIAGHDVGALGEHAAALLRRTSAPPSFARRSRNICSKVPLFAVCPRSAMA